MDKKCLDFVIEKTHELLEAPTSCDSVKEAANAWLAAIGTENEAEATRKYLNELEEDIVLIDDLINLAESEKGIQYFGSELAKNIAVHGKEIKAEGAVYCDCPACKAVEAILEKKDCILK